MKKILFSAIAAIGLLLSPGCSDDNEVVSGGNDSLVSFSVGLENGIQTKAISDGTRAQNLVVGVYENIGDSYEEIPALRSKDQTFNVGPDGKPKAAVTFNLVKGKTYSFIFWAQAQPVDGTADKPFDIRDLRDIKVDYSAANCNDEARDAFVGVVKDLKVSGTYEQDVTLKRPFAQLNFLVTKEELEAADNSTNLELKKSQITLSKAATVLQPFTNTVDGFTEAAVTFQPTAIPMLSDEYNNTNSQTHPKVGDPSTTDTYYYLATTYFLVPAAGNSNDAGKARTTLSSVNLKLANDEGTQAEGPGFTAHTVPVQWNYRTNIYGSLLTADGQFNVEIVPSFNTENNVEQPQTVMVASVEEANVALANGATSVTVQNAPTSDASLNIPKSFEQGNEATVELTIPASSHEITIGYGEQTNKEPKYVVLNAPTTDHLTIDLEYSTVTLNGENYNEVTATTWDNTLIVPAGTTIQTLHVKKGNVKIYGTVNNLSLAEDCQVLVWEVKTSKALKQAVENKCQNIVLKEGTFTFPNVNVNGLSVAFEGAGVDKTIIDLTQPRSGMQYNYGKATFKNLTMKRASGSYGGLYHTQKEYYEDCQIEGTLVTYASETVVKGTSFVQSSSDNYNVHVYGVGKTVFEDCSFTCHGKSIYAHADERADEYDITITDCTFNAETKVAGKAAIQLHTESGIHGKLTINNATASGFDSSINGGLWNEVNNSTKIPTNLFVKTINGQVCENEIPVTELNGVYEIYNAQGLKWFREQASSNDLLKGKTIKLMADIDMNDLLPEGGQVGDANWTSFDAAYHLNNSTIDGNGHTIKNMVIKSLINGGYGCGFLADTKGNITIKNLTFDHADVTTGDYRGNVVGIVVGYNYATATFDNVTVKNSRVNGFGKVGVLLGMAADLSCKVVFKNCKTVGNTIEACYNAGGLAGLVLGRSAGAPDNITIENCTVDNTFVPDLGATYETLNTKVATGDSGTKCPGPGTVIKGLYWNYDGYLYGAYGEYCVSYGDSGHDCALEGTSEKLANSELVLNKDWTPVQNN